MTSCIQIRSSLQAYIDEELGTVEKLLFEQHLRSCDSCKIELDHARTVAVRLFEMLGRDRLQDDLTPAIMAHLPEMDCSRLTPMRIYRIPHLDKKKHVPWYATAATLMPVFVPMILLVLAGLLWMYWPSGLGADAPPAGIITYAEGTAQAARGISAKFDTIRARDYLANGSLIRTGSGARLLFGLMGPSHATLYGDSLIQVLNDRELVLEKGRVFLDIHAEQRHFRVTTPHGLITVLGTSFHVATTPEGTEVTVVNGQVLVENDHNFALLTRGNQAFFNQDAEPIVRSDIKAVRYLEEARSVLPDCGAERLFMSRFVTPATESAPAHKQVFMVETKRRIVSALILNWLPDPYAEGHAGYLVYVSNGAMKPLFKASLDPTLFQDKTKSTIRVPVPQELQEQAVSMLHITLIPDYRSGQLETTFTEVSAIGVRP